MTTLIIPCAGMGTRLGSGDTAKALTLLGKETLLSTITNKVGSLFQQIVIVSSRSHIQDFHDFILTHPQLPKTRIVVQENPSGSLNAVNLASIYAPDDCVVIWGDQIGVSKNTVEATLHTKNMQASFAVPRIFVSEPYVWLKFTADGKRMNGVGRTRDGDYANQGWADLGVFYFSKESLERLRLIEGQLVSNLTDREADLIYALPLLAEEFISYFPIRTEISELLAINTPEDLTQAKMEFNE